MLPYHHVLCLQMGTLNEEVSVLSKGLHHMMHLLQAHISMQHYNTYPYGLQMVSMSTSHPGTDVSFSPSTAYHLRSEPASFGSPGRPHATQWGGCSTAPAEAHMTGRQQTQLGVSPPINPGCRPVQSGAPKRANTPSEWSTGPLLNISPGSQGEGPPAVPHSEGRPLGASPTAISQSQPALCLQPPTDADGFSCLLTSRPSAVSTQSLLDSSPASNPHPTCLPAQLSVNTPNKHTDKLEEICIIPTADAHNVMEDSSMFQIKDSCPPMLPVSASSTLSSLPSRRSSLESVPLRSETLDPRLPLCDPPANLERLLGNGAFEEGRDG